MPTITLTDIVLKRDGTPWASAEVRFSARDFFVAAADGAYPQKHLSVTTAVDGSLSVTLAVPDTGATRYLVSYPENSGSHDIVVTQDDDNKTVRELISANAPAPLSLWQGALSVEVAARQAEDAALDARIDALIITGGGDLTYRHVQASPSTSWVVAHGLGKRVSVSIVDSAGDQVFGNVSYASDNQVVISFSAALAGEAYCN